MTRKFGIEIPYEAIDDFCRRHHIRKLSLFGSVLREDFRPDSDVDVLVEFEESYQPGLQFFGMARELSEIIGRKVDFLTEGWIHPRILSRVLDEAQPVYAAA